MVLSLTPAGRRLWRRVMALAARRDEEIFGCLSSAERKRLGALLDRLIAHAGPHAPRHPPLRGVVPRARRDGDHRGDRPQR